MTNKMIQFLSTLIPTISEKANKIVDAAMLTDKSWFFLNDFSTDSKIIYIFNSENELLVSKNGVVSIGKWKSIVHSTNSILVTVDSEMIFYNIIFLNFEYLILQQDGTSKHLFFAKQEKYSFNESIDSFNSFIENYVENIKHFLNSNYKQNIYLPELKNQSIKEKKTETVIKAKEEPILPKKEVPKKIEVPIKKEPDKKNEKFVKPHQKNGKWGFINENDEIVIKHQFDDAFPFFEGLSAVIINGKRGYINVQGDYIVEPIYESGTYFKDGKAQVTLNGQDFYIDKNGLRIS
jgi:hypothetical protein